MRFPLAFLALCPLLLNAQQADSISYPSVPPVDAPELAARGPYGVGVRTLELSHPDQIDILSFDADAGEAPRYDRPLPVEVWYPATIPAGKREHVVYQAPLGGAPGEALRTFDLPGKALRDAAPLDERFPLVLVSHGYPGYRTFLSYLTENLASKGYVVAAVDHTDSVVGAVKGFQSTLLNRAKDQLFVIDELRDRAGRRDSFLHELINPDRVAIVGYSMGGYGALAAAGAGYSREGGAFTAMVPGGLLGPMTHEAPGFQAIERDHIRAVVAIAPWGAQAPHRNWSEEALADLRKPILFIAGDQDDISGFEDGIRRLLEQTVSTERYLLVYQNARHNIGGNPPPAEALNDFKSLEFFGEPVWRKDRILAINQHFVTAFLDLYLKGDESKRAYLRPPTTESNEGRWPLERGESAGDAYSPGEGSEGFTYWKGFRRRWALGLELHVGEPRP